MRKIWENKLEEAKNEFKLAELNLELANREAKEKRNIKGIERWLDYEFESSTTLTPEFAEFRREIKSYIKKVLPKELELIMPFGTLHFEFSGFIKNKKTGKFVYFSCSDVRSWKNAWYENLLIRTAENEKDFTGGSNDCCKLPEIGEKAKKLTK